MGEKIFEKMPFYNFINILLTGILFLAFVFFMKPSYFIDLMESIVGIGSVFMMIISAFLFAIAYEVGYLVFRIGGTIIEFLIVKFKIVYFYNDYEQLNKSRKDNPALYMLSREYAFARTQATEFLIFMIVIPFYYQFTYMFIFLVLAIICLLTARKHSKKIVDIIKPK